MTWCNKFGIHYLLNDVPVSLLSILIPCIMLYEHSCLHLLHCMWLGCIRTCTKDLIHGILTNRWLVHNQFMALGNPLEVVVHHLLIGGMVGLGYRHRFPMVCSLVCMVLWRLSSSHDLAKLLYCVVLQPWESIELVLNLAMTLTYG